MATMFMVDNNVKLHLRSNKSEVKQFFFTTFNGLIECDMQLEMEI